METLVLIIFIPILIFLLYSCSWFKKVYKVENFESENSPFEPKYSKIPNVIWTFWDGDEPELVKRCIGSWKKYNPEYKIIVLNKSNVNDYTDADFESIPHTSDFIQRYADFVRVNVVKKYGGIWMDASIICQKSLMWVHDIQNKTGSKFICYYRDGFTLPEFKESAPITENWFFASTKECEYIRELYKEMLNFSSFEKVEEYLDDLKERDMSFQNVPPERYDYLVMYIIGSVVLQQKENGLKHYKVKGIKADDTALRHWIVHNFDQEKGAKELLQNNFGHRNEKLIKIVGVVRNELIKITDDYSVLF
jgi:hypothetical protein